MNALAALAAAEHVGVPMPEACEALLSFKNVKRRMEWRGEVKGIALYDDFAHHPTAIRTTIDGLRRKVGNQARILAVFEPRSNTMKLGAIKAQLPWSLEAADWAFCHSGGLQWDAKQVLSPLGAQAVVADSIEALVAQVVKVARQGDHILCMSNGSFGGIHDKLLAALAA
jgi:UDP-N-acetylmuramate: L-alanyl-gamma-D-glutamyl-meso-diaminopimelate ligase